MRSPVEVQNILAPLPTEKSPEGGMEGFTDIVSVERRRFISEGNNKDSQELDLVLVCSLRRPN